MRQLSVCNNSACELSSRLPLTSRRLPRFDVTGHSQGISPAPGRLKQLHRFQGTPYEVRPMDLAEGLDMVQRHVDHEIRAIHQGCQKRLSTLVVVVDQVCARRGLQGRRDPCVARAKLIRPPRREESFSVVGIAVSDEGERYSVPFGGLGFVLEL